MSPKLPVLISTLLGCLFLPSHVGPIWAQETRCLIVGVGEYDDPAIDDLDFIVNDVMSLEKTLTQYGSEVSEVEIMHDETNSSLPTRSNIRQKIIELTESCGPKDRLIFYFSGHGFKGKDGNLWLLPSDAKVGDRQKLGIEVSWIREQLGRSQAHTKLVLLDSCFAGTQTKLALSDPIDPESLGREFGVLTLASCSANQSSLVWKEKRQSLFTYWLNLGLKGNADRNKDGSVNVDELYEYIFQHVQHSSRTWFGEDNLQSPRRHTAEVAGVPEILTLRPQDLPIIVSNMTEQIAWDLLENEVHSLAIAAFTSLSATGEEVVNGPFGSLALTCPRDVEEHIRSFMQTHPDDRLEIANYRTLQNALRQVQFSTEDLGNVDKLRELRKLTGADSIVFGTFQNRSQRTISLRLEAINLENANVICSVGGTAVASDHTLAEIGLSGVPQEHMINVAPPTLTPTQPIHPLQNNDLPFQIGLTVDGQPRRPSFCDGECFVPVTRGKPFAISLENRSEKMVMVRLTVDGYDTMMEEGVPKRVHLQDATLRFLDPGRSYSIRGIASKTGPLADGEKNLRVFQVVDASQSLAAQSQFSDQIGLISAVFYEIKKVSKERGVGMTLGDAITDQIEVRRGFDAGKMLGVINLRYHDETETISCP